MKGDSRYSRVSEILKKTSRRVLINYVSDFCSVLLMSWASRVGKDLKHPLEQVFCNVIPLKHFGQWPPNSLSNSAIAIKQI